MVVRNSEPPIKPKITSNGRRTAATIIEPAIIISERADSGNGGSDEDTNRVLYSSQKPVLACFLPEQPLSAIINSDYIKSSIANDETNHSTTLDYKSLLTMAKRTSSSATTTLLQRHQEILSFYDQPIIKRQPLSITNNDSIFSTSHVSMPSTTKNIAYKENISIPTNNFTIQEIHHNDGRIERVKSDLSKQIVFPNSDYKQKLSDGRYIYKYASTNTTETEYPDGTHIYEFPNGRQEHILPDKTKNIYLTDGTIISIKTNGEKFIQQPNQTK
ncbi:unnamed protein product [Rotaria sp. Silwood1]|nr:unnamed protein product [Rotaria sp. Silwood1]CAF4901947.1 unnamed protein product [Rotaria sp. Silwood1]